MHNTKIKDNAGRTIFENATLCSQFLSEYTGIEIFKDLKAENIEDMTERFLPMFSEERDSDVVKKITLNDDKELYVITLIEHKSSVDHNTVMQVFHYMSYIWEEYEKSMESKQKGVIKSKDFKYPPIIPIVYYEDTAKWTAPIYLRDRVFMSDMFAEYLPDYRYLLFRLQDHGDAELISKRDEISLIMLINRLRDAFQFKKLEFPEDYFDEMKNKLSGDVLAVLSRMIESYLRTINMPDEDIYRFTDQFKEGNMARFFENFEPFDIQEYGRRNREEGETIKLIKQVYFKLRKNKTVEQIADELEESDNIAMIRDIVDLIREATPNLDLDEDELAQNVLEKLSITS